MVKARTVDLLSRILGRLFLLIMIVFITIPFFMMVVTSFKSLPEINDMANRSLARRIFPDNITYTKNYVQLVTGRAELLNGTSFLLYIRNSLFVTVFSLIVALFFVLTAGFAFAKYEFPLKNLMFYMIIALLMVPMEMISIPLYLVMARLRLINTYIGIMVPFFISAFGIFLIKESIEPIPRDYIEAARVDGASEFWIFFRVIIPMIRTSIVTFIIIKFIWTWNEYFWPLLVVNVEELKTVTLGLSKFSNDYFKEYGQLTAAVVLSLIPTLVIYIFTRRYIVRGIMLSGLKS